MIVFYDGANIHTVSAGPTDRVRLVPGRNTVADDVWKRLTQPERGSESLLEMIGEGKVRVQAPKGEGEGTVSQEAGVFNIGEMIQSDAVEAIQNEMDLEVLKTYRRQELDRERRRMLPRKVVLQAIDAQERKLGRAPAPKPPGTDEATAPKGKDRTLAIEAAVGAILDEDGTKHITKDGRPTTDALTDAVGFKVTAKERDAAYEAVIEARSQEPEQPAEEGGDEDEGEPETDS